MTVPISPPFPLSPFPENRDCPHFCRSYTYNAIGNITSASDLGAYTYAGTGYANPHAVTSIGANSYTYDTNGNTLTAGSNTYSFDYRNRLGTTTVGTSTTTYKYDHTFERIQKTTGGVITVYPNDAWNRGGSTTTIHITDNQGIELATIEGNGISTTTVYSHQDHLGSTNVLTKRKRMNRMRGVFLQLKLIQQGALPIHTKAENS